MERMNVRFCSFYDFIVEEYYTDGLFLINRETKENKLICNPLLYNNNTLRIDLSNLTDEEYQELESNFTAVVRTDKVYSNCIIIYLDKDYIIYLGKDVGEK